MADDWQVDVHTRKQTRRLVVSRIQDVVDMTRHELIRHLVTAIPIANLCTMTHKELWQACDQCIKDSTIDKMIRLYRYLWLGTIPEFGVIYGTHKSNFSRWLNGKRDSPKSCRAVRLYLRDLNSIFYAQTDWSNASKEVGASKEAAKVGTHDWCTIPQYISIDTFTANLRADVERVIFVDTENQQTAIRLSTEQVISGHLCNVQVIFVVHFEYHSIEMNHTWLYELPEDSSIICVRADQSNREAVDLKLAMYAALAHIHLPKDIFFTIISKDKGFAEVRDTLAHSRVINIQSM